MADNNESSKYTDETFIAYVDAIIPRTPYLAQVYGNVMYYGALDLLTNEYMIMVLNYAYVPMADIAAKLLDLFAYQLYNLNNMQTLLNVQTFNKREVFITLPPIERIRAVSLLDYLNVYYLVLLLQYQGYPGIIYIMSSLNRYTISGYYSEWFGYGSTRLDKPSKRVLQFHPISWEQVGYPGPSFTYIATVRDYYSSIENMNIKMNTNTNTNKNTNMNSNTNMNTNLNMR